MKLTIHYMDGSSYTHKGAVEWYEDEYIGVLVVTISKKIDGFISSNREFLIPMKQIKYISGKKEDGFKFAKSFKKKSLVRVSVEEDIVLNNKIPTPCQKLGYQVGDWFIKHLGKNKDKGSYYKLVYDDGTNCPLFVTRSLEIVYVPLSGLEKALPIMQSIEV